MVRAAVSQSTKNAPPKTAEAGRSNRCPGPSTRRQMCGDIIPTNPIGPQAATTPPTITDVATKSVVRVLATANAESLALAERVIHQAVMTAELLAGRVQGRARLRGEKIWWLMRQEILPNAMPPLVAEFGLRFCFVFLFIASLSFLGLGIQPPMADWGGMVRENAGAITFGIMTPLFPAAAIAFLTVGVNLIVDWFLHIASGLKD